MTGTSTNWESNPHNWGPPIVGLLQSAEATEDLLTTRELQQETPPWTWQGDLDDFFVK